MALSERDQVSLRNYLLGHLSHEEQEKLEERLMTDDDLFQEFEISKSELIEEYRAGELEKPEQNFFEGHFLQSREGRQSNIFAAALDLAASRQPVAQPVYQTHGSFLTRQRWLVGTATAAALVATVAVMFYLSRPRTPYSITLANSMLSRDSGAENLLPLKVKLPPNTSELRASLTLPKAFPSGTRFQAKLDNRTDTRPVDVVEQNDKLVTVAVPVSELPRGEYGLKLSAIVDGREEEIPGSYYFDIE